MAKKEIHEYAGPGADWKGGKRQIRTTPKTPEEKSREQFNKIKKKLDNNYENDFLRRAEQAIKDGTSEQKILLREEYWKHDSSSKGKNLSDIVAYLKAQR